MKFTYVLIGTLCLLCLFIPGNIGLVAQQTTSIQIEQPYLDPNWRPTAYSYLTIDIVVTVPTGFSSGTLVAELQNVTEYDGDSGNTTCTGPGKQDLTLPKNTDYNAGWVKDGSTLTYTLSTSESEQTISLSIFCTDYAAYGELVLTASGYTSNTVTLKIPRDENGNKIADGWRNDATVNYGRDDDNDSGPNSKTGDSITVLNEYRGLYVNGTWTDTDPDGWDVFVRSDVGIGYANYLPMTVYEMSSTEVCWDTGRVYPFEIARESGETWRHVYAIRVAEDTATEDDDGDPITLLGIMTYGPPESGTTGTIYTTNITNATTTLGVTDVSGYTDTIIAHEIGHGVNLDHCPDYNHLYCYMWGWPDAVTHFENGFDGHHGQDYDLVYNGDEHRNRLRSFGPYPSRAYSSDRGMYLRCREDIDGDGVVDLLDLLRVVTSVSSEIGYYVSDVNRDNVVDISDMKLVAAAFGITASISTDLSPDINGDGVVDDVDLALVDANMGERGANDADVNGDCIVNEIDYNYVGALRGHPYWTRGNTVPSPEE